LKATVELPGADLLARPPGLVTSRAREVPGAAEAAHPAGSIPTVRALLRCVPAEGTAGAVDVLGEVDGTSPGGTPVTGAYTTPPPLAELMADLLTGPDGVTPPACSTPRGGGGRLLVAAAGRGATRLAGQDLVDSPGAGGRYGRPWPGRPRSRYGSATASANRSWRGCSTAWPT
jgi:hypothetical protein